MTDLTTSGNPPPQRAPSLAGEPKVELDEEAQLTGQDFDFVELLAAYDQSRSIDKRAAVDLTNQVAELGLLDEFEKAKECIDLIEQIWPRTTTLPSECQAPETQRSDRDAPLSSSSQGDPSGQLGRFEIRRELGRGGGGIVYLAFDPKLQREVALKVPHPEFLFDRELRHRFLHEARVAACLDHPNIIPVYETGEAGPICYIASAYCQGPTLASWLSSLPSSVESQTAATLIAQLAAAMEHAHGCDILHRDLKPSNVLLEPCARPSRLADCPTSGARSDDRLADFVPKLTDFGLAKSLDPDASVTRTGAIVGTAAYMAPEQADGRQDDICPSTDVYALGAMLYELLTGRVPFQADTDVRTLRQIVIDEPVPPRRLRNNIPRDLEAICLKCLEKTPQARYASADDLARDLGRFLVGHATVARPAGVGQRLVNWSRRQPATAALIMVSQLFLFAVAGITSWYRSDLNQAQQDAVQAGDAATQWRQEASQQLNVQTRHAYVDNVHHAYMAWSNARVATALELLDRCRPGPGEEDERGFEWYYVRRLCEGGLQKMWGHQDRAIHGASFSPDGNRLATCGEDGSINIWKASTGELLADFKAHTSCVRDVAFSPAGRMLASVGDDGKLSLWDPDTYEKSGVIEPGTGKLRCLAISQDGQTIAVAGDGATITVWNREHGEEQFVVAADCSSVDSLDLAADGKLAAACRNETVIIWDLASPNAPYRVIESVGAIESLAFSPDGQRLATGGDFVHIWHLDADRPPTFLPGHESFVHSIAFSADGKLLASTGGDEVIRIWDVTTGAERHCYYSHMRPVFDLAFSPRGYRLASVDKGGSIRIWNADGPQDRCPLRMDLQGRDVRLAFAPVGETLAIATGGKRDVSLWRARACGDVEFVDDYTADVPHVTSPQCITYSPNGRYLAVATNKDRIVFDSDLRPVDTHTFGPQGPITHEAILSVHGLLAESTAGDDGKISIFDAESARPVTGVKGYRGIAFSPDGNLLAMESAKTMFAIELWDLASDRSLAVMPGHTGQVFSMAFSADGNMVASGSVDGSLRLWDTSSHRETKAMRGHADGILQVAFSPNQKSVVTSSGDGTVRFWDVLTGRSMLELRVTSETFRSLSFSADGQVLATAYLTGSNPMEGHVDLWCAPRP